VDVSLIYELTASDPHDQAVVRRLYRETVEQVQLADRLGYRTVWFTEHHFMPDLSQSSAPEEMLAFLAAKTENIRLGHGVVLLPHAINHPARVAEKVAVLDVLSEGRVEFGSGRALNPGELEAFRVDPDDSRAQWLEALQAIPKMWMQKTFSFDGEWLKMPERHVVPKPVQQPHPPMWTAATQPSTIEAAGRMGIGALIFGSSYEAAIENVTLYRESIKHAEPVGGFINDRFGVFMQCLCAPTDEEAIAIQGKSHKAYIKLGAELFKPWMKGDVPKSYEHVINLFKGILDQVETVTSEDIVAAGGAAIGSPETLVKIFQRLSDAGVDEVLLYMQAFQTPHDAIMRSIELIAREVMPKVSDEARGS
jgi:alkanesulfonate monooxygenase SsuD/methylene tetrahydromethanopterin reductase-like flavin-dependent oxidoreductase (luciferase family)